MVIRKFHSEKFFCAIVSQTWGMVIEALIDALTQIGIFSVVGAIFYKLSDNYIQSEFDKKVEEHKAELDKENQRFQNTLEQEAQEFQHQLDKEQVRFTELQERRAEKIEEMYQLLVRFSRNMTQAFDPGKTPSGKDREQLLQEAKEAGKEFQIYFQENRIYLPMDVDQDLQVFIQESGKIVNKFAIYDLMNIREDSPFRSGTVEDIEQWKEEWNKVNKEVLPPLKQDLEEEFRDILGVE